MQKRGVIVDSEDYNGVLETYPAHPSTHKQPKHKMLRDLEQTRREEVR
jgi:hypothetical protein